MALCGRKYKIATAIIQFVKIKRITTIFNSICCHFLYQYQRIVPLYSFIFLLINFVMFINVMKNNACDDL